MQMKTFILMTGFIGILGGLAQGLTYPVRTVLDDFEDKLIWTAGGGERGGSGSVALSGEQTRTGRQSLSWMYDVRSQTGSRSCVYSRCGRSRVMPGEPTTFSLWILGDGSGNRIGYRFADTTGRTWQSHLVVLDFKGWKKIEGEFSTKGYHWGGGDTPADRFAYPLTFLELVLDKGETDGPETGTIYLDDFTVQTRLARKDSIIVTPRMAWEKGIGVGTSPGMTVEVKNLISVPANMLVTWNLKDYSGRCQREGKQAVAMAANSKQVIPVAVELPHRGY